MNGVARMLVLSGIFATAAFGCLADGAPPSDSYYISMRSPDVDATPRFITVTLDQSDAQSEPFAACDGETYYMTTDDKAALNAALANGNTVQLQDGPPETAAQDTSVVCLVQASQ